MSTLIRCDACAERLSEHVVSVCFSVGAIALNRGTEAHFIGSERPREYVLCHRCARYVDRCVGVITPDEAAAS